MTGPTAMGVIAFDILREHAKRVVIEDGALRYRVSVEGTASALLSALVAPKAFFKTKRAAYSTALGYATGLAVELQCELVDRTGKITEEDCAELVTAMRADNYGGQRA